MLMAKTTRTCHVCNASYNVYLDNDSHRTMLPIDTKQGRVYVCTHCTTDTPINNRIIGTPKRHGFQYRITTTDKIALLAYGFTRNEGLCQSPLYNGLCAPSKLELGHCTVSICNSRYDGEYWQALARNCAQWISADCITIETDDLIRTAQYWTEILSKCHQLYTDISDTDILDVNMQYAMARIKAKYSMKYNGRD